MAQKIIAKIGYLDVGDEWEEDFNIPDNKSPIEGATEIVSQFNDSLRKGERPRRFIGIVSSEKTGNSHTWIKRTDGMSVTFRGRTADLMYCEKCGITGKRFGLQSAIKRDSKYKAKRYEFCDE